MKSIRTEEFFKKISINSGGVDLDTVRRVYFGMITTISRELKGPNQNVKLINWGRFYLKTSKHPPTLKHYSGRTIKLGSTTVVKFKRDYKVKAYFKDIGVSK